MKNNLVIYHFEGQTENFNGIKVTIKSLREFYQDKIVLLYNNISDKLKNFLTTQNVELVDCSTYKVLYKTSPYNNKIIYSFLFLKKNKELLKDYNILISDIGDFYFKINPFDLLKDKLVLTLEDKKIKSCDVNTAWSDICYGPELKYKINENIVINGGFIMGSFLQIYNFCEKMLNEMAKILSRINYPNTDQIIINKLVYLDNEECFLEKENINHLAQGIKTTVDNKINHQYKVNEQLRDFLYKKYE